MFERQYVFETKATQRKRMIARIFFFCLIPIFLYFGFMGIILRFAALSNIETADFLARKAPDVIIVYTGDEGRIPWAMKIIEKYPSTKLLITGVYNKNTTQALIERYLGDEEKVGPDQVDVDYLANNTVENSIFTIRYIRSHPEYKNVLIVSSDYHLLRIKMALDMIGVENVNSPMSFYFHGIESDREDWRTLRLFTKEVYKFWKAFIFLLLWDTET